MGDVRQRKDNREGLDINNSKIKYLKVVDKIYKITKISFFNMAIEAIETDLTINDVPTDELWDLEKFKRYKVKLINNGGMTEIVDFSDWVNRCK